MADYWKSQAKKYCEFCKCWLADNKPSVEFHEKGRKHKENVARKLRVIGKQSRRDQKEQFRVDLALKKMESAALDAYRKDIESNADISSRAINETLQQNNLELSSKKLWHEVKNKDGEGPSYYWNTETDESVWVPPSSGYLSLAEQEAQAFVATKKQLQNIDSYKKKNDLVKLQDQKDQAEEERAAAEREKMKARRVVEEPEPVITAGPIVEPSFGPYGQWKTVETQPKRQMDLQLPKQEEYVAISIPLDKPEPIKLFKEKTIKTLADEEDSCASTSFKKRKFGGNKNRNVRQRVKDD